MFFPSYVPSFICHSHGPTSLASSLSWSRPSPGALAHFAGAHVFPSGLFFTISSAVPASSPRPSIPCPRGHFLSLPGLFSFIFESMRVLSRAPCFWTLTLQASQLLHPPCFSWADSFAVFSTAFSLRMSFFHTSSIVKRFFFYVFSNFLRCCRVLFLFLFFYIDSNAPFPFFSDLPDKFRISFLSPSFCESFRPFGYPSRALGIGEEALYYADEPPKVSVARPPPAVFCCLGWNGVPVTSATNKFLSLLALTTYPGFGAFFFLVSRLLRHARLPFFSPL